MNARVDHLVAEGLARRQGQRVVFARDLLETLRRRELDSAATEIGSRSGLPYNPAKAGDAVAGVYRQRIDLASGRFAMIDDGLGFSLVPWSPSLERHFGRHVSGIAHVGSIEWSFGRTRGLGIAKLHGSGAHITETLDTPSSAVTIIGIVWSGLASGRRTKIFLQT